MHELVLRSYHPSDADEVWKLHQVSLEAEGAYMPDSEYDSDFQNIEGIYLKGRGTFIVGEVDGRIVTMGALRRKQDDVAEIKRMRTHPDFQRRGYASKVLSYLEDVARRLGYSEIVLDTTTLQVAAQRFYESRQYSESHRVQHSSFANIFYHKSL